MSTLSNLFNPFPAPHPRYYYDLSTELSPALQLSIPVGPHQTDRGEATGSELSPRLGGRPALGGMDDLALPAPAVRSGRSLLQAGDGRGPGVGGLPRGLPG